MRVYAPTSMERLDHVFLRSLPWRRRALFSAALASFRAATSFRFFSNASSLFWRKATGSKDPLPSADLCFLSSRFLIVLFVVFFPEGIERRAPMPAAANPRVLIFLKVKCAPHFALPSPSPPSMHPGLSHQCSIASRSSSTPMAS